MNISEAIQEVHQNAVNKGFWEDKETKNVPELLMLCVSELSEALEAHRKGKHANGVFIKQLECSGHNWFDSPKNFKACFESDIKDTFEDEITDTVIRLFDLCGGLNIDLEHHIFHKMRYNAGREHKHGKKY